jgi:hypothetical protein
MNTETQDKWGRRVVLALYLLALAAGFALGFLR